MSYFKRLNRVLAGLVALTFFVTNTFTPAPVAHAQTVEPMSQLLGENSFKIPAEFGKISDTILHPSSGSPILIHIQEAHANYDAQKNIRSILQHLSQNYGIRLVLLEGAGNKLQPELFRFFPKDAELQQAVNEKLLQAGELTGAEVFLLDNDQRLTTNDQRLKKVSGRQSMVNSHQSSQSVSAFGVENAAAYAKDREAYKKVYEGRGTADRFLQDAYLEWQKQASLSLPKELREFLGRFVSYEEERLPLPNWLETLKEQAFQTLKTDLSDTKEQIQWPVLVRYFRLRELDGKIDGEKAEEEKTAFLRDITQYGIHNSRNATGPQGHMKTSGDFVALWHDVSALFESAKKHDLPIYKTRFVFERLLDALPDDFSFDPYPNLRLQIQQMILLSEVQGDALQSEIKALTAKIVEASVKKDEDKALVRTLREYRLLTKLFHLELSREEYQQIQSRGITPEKLSLGLGTRTSGLAKTRNQNESLVPSPQSLFATAMQFYAGAVEREDHMMKCVREVMAERKETKAVLITGGFHTDGFKQKAVAAGSSYIQITPNVGAITPEDQRNYLRALLGPETRDKRQQTKTGFAPVSRLQSPVFERSEIAANPDLDGPFMVKTAGRRIFSGRLASIRSEARQTIASLRPDAIPQYNAALDRGVQNIIASAVGRSEAREEKPEVARLAESSLEKLPFEERTKADELLSALLEAQAAKVAHVVVKHGDLVSVDHLTGNKALAIFMKQEQRFARKLFDITSDQTLQAVVDHVGEDPSFASYVLQINQKINRIRANSKQESRSEVRAGKEVPLDLEGIRGKSNVRVTRDGKVGTVQDFGGGNDPFVEILFDGESSAQRVNLRGSAAVGKPVLFATEGEARVSQAAAEAKTQKAVSELERTWPKTMMLARQAISLIKEKSLVNQSPDRMYVHSRWMKAIRTASQAEKPPKNFEYEEYPLSDLEYAQNIQSLVEAFWGAYAGRSKGKYLLSNATGVERLVLWKILGQKLAGDIFFSAFNLRERLKADPNETTFQLRSHLYKGRISDDAIREILKETRPGYSKSPVVISRWSEGGFNTQEGILRAIPVVERILQTEIEKRLGFGPKIHPRPIDEIPSVTLPSRPSERTSRSEARDERLELTVSNIRVLVVEDEENNWVTARVLLSDQGVLSPNVLRTRSIEETREALRSGFLPDIIILDNTVLGAETGLDLLREIRDPEQLLGEFPALQKTAILWNSKKISGEILDRITARSMEKLNDDNAKSIWQDVFEAAKKKHLEFLARSEVRETQREPITMATFAQSGKLTIGTFLWDRALGVGEIVEKAPDGMRLQPTNLNSEKPLILALFGNQYAEFTEPDFKAQSGRLFLALPADIQRRSEVRAGRPDEAQLLEAQKILQGKTILLVDDDTDFSGDFKDILEASITGVKVYKAQNGKEALDILAGRNVDLVFTDYQMPVLNGRQLVLEMKTQLPQIPVIMQTGAVYEIPDLREELNIPVILRASLSPDGLIIYFASVLGQNKTGAPQQKSTRSEARTGDQVGRIPEKVVQEDEELKGLSARVRAMRLQKSPEPKTPEILPLSRGTTSKAEFMAQREERKGKVRSALGFGQTEHSRGGTKESPVRSEARDGETAQPNVLSRTQLLIRDYQRKTDKESHVKIVELLGLQNNHEATPFLVNLLSDGNPEIVLAAIESLTKIGIYDAEVPFEDSPQKLANALDIMLEELQEKGAHVTGVMTSDGTISVPETPNVPLIRKTGAILPSSPLRTSSSIPTGEPLSKAGSWRKVDTAVSPHVREQIHLAKLFSAVVTAFGVLGIFDSVPTLLKTYGVSSVFQQGPERQALLLAFRHFGKDGVPHLQAAMMTDKNPAVRKICAEALWRFMETRLQMLVKYFHAGPTSVMPGTEKAVPVEDIQRITQGMGQRIADDARAIFNPDPPTLATLYILLEKWADLAQMGQAALPTIEEAMQRSEDFGADLLQLADVQKSIN